MTDSIRAAMRATNSLFTTEIFAKGNMEAFDHIYTRDARILPPGGAMVVGRVAIKNFWSEFIHAAHATGATLETLEATVAGDSVIEIGKAVLTVQAPGQHPAHAEVKYVVCWREEDGRWKWDIDIWNPNA